jgi:site-specific DNA recombinase
MKDLTAKRGLRCAIYTRVSTDQGLEQDFNSLDAQREASEAYIKSQAHEGWRLARDHYNDGGYSGGSMDRPALQKLLADVQARRIDVIVVYKVDRRPDRSQTSPSWSRCSTGTTSPSCR